MLFALGVWAGTTAERYFGGIDPGPVVIDEVVGMLITLAFIPVGWSGALAGFLLFRMFDVIKPYPAGRFERLHGGLGVMADDAMAAVYANMSLRVIDVAGSGMDRVNRPPLATAEIIAVGSELLGATRLDTNSLFLAGRLGDFGIELRAKSVVADDRDRLRAVFLSAMSRSDLVILTGGLGPTDDDLTREVVAAALDRPLSEDAAIVERIRQRFDRRGLRMPDVNRRQAMVPAGGVVLDNPNGTAPGLMIEHGATSYRGRHDSARMDAWKARARHRSSTMDQGRELTLVRFANSGNRSEQFCIQSPLSIGIFKKPSQTVIVSNFPTTKSLLTIKHIYQNQFIY